VFKCGARCLPFVCDTHVDPVGTRFFLGRIDLESIERLSVNTGNSSGSVQVGLR
ncbi:hypothetical protein A2U01_0085375, partial [Trifolium medium]|nr:hypothetical protein [Trifolium medium]